MSVSFRRLERSLEPLQHTVQAVQVVLPANFQAGISDNRVSLNAGFDRHPTSFFSAASFRAPPFAYNDSHPLLHLSLSLLPSLLPPSFSIRPVHSLLAFFSLGADRDSALRLFDVRSLPGGRPLQNGYAFTRLHRRKKGRHRDQGGESSHSAFPPRRGSSVLRQRERERGRGEGEGEVLFPAANGTGGGEMRVARKW